MGTRHGPTGTDLPAGESSGDSPKYGQQPDTAKLTAKAQVDDIAAGLSAVNLESDTDSQTDSDIDDRDDDHVPEPATVRRWEVIDRIMDSLYSKLEAKITQTKAATAPEPAPPSQLLPKRAALERRSSGERPIEKAKERRRQNAAQPESEGVCKEGESDEEAEADKQEAMVNASTDEAPHQPAVIAARPPPPPPAGSTPSPAPAPEPVLSKAKKSAGSSFMGLLTRKATERLSRSDAQTSLPPGSTEPPQPPGSMSSSAPAARPPAPATSSLRTLAPAPPRATTVPASDASSHLGILSTLASALSAGGTQDVPAHLPQVIGEERDHLREQLANMYAAASPASRGGPLFGTGSFPFLHGAQSHARSAQVPPMPSQRGLTHTSIPTAPPSSRRTPQASYSTWQLPSATGSTSGQGFAALGSGDQSSQGLNSSHLGQPREEFQVQGPNSQTPVPDVGINNGFRGLGLPGFPQPHIHMHRNVTLQGPSPPNHEATSPLSEPGEAEDYDGEQQDGRRRKSRIRHLTVDEGIASDHDGRRKKARKGDNANAALGGQRKFACPYFKRNKKKYSKWTSCPGPGWDEVHRVKTHLYRRHALPIQCVRCWEVFKTDELLNAHLQQDPPCETRKNQALVEGFTKDQEKKLRSRKKAQADTTDEDKWREIYMILFPYDDVQTIPSPFYEASDYEGEAGGTSGSGDLEDYATFVQREMPTLVRRELETLFEKEFQDVEEPLRRRVAEIVVKLQPRLLNLYKQTQTPLSDYGPPSNEPSAGTTGSEPGLTPTMSYHTPESDSTPGTNVEGSVPLGFDVDDMFDFDGILGVGQTQQPQQQFGALGNPVFSWDEDFDKLINPTFFMPQTHGADGGLLVPNYAGGSQGANQADFHFPISGDGTKGWTG